MEKLKAYLIEKILPLYDSHDKGHDRSHVEAVIQSSMELCRNYPVKPQLCYVIAVYHDAGISEGRATHHLSSARILRQDRELLRFFTQEEIELMAQAVEDHRASGEEEPRSIYGKIISEADRLLDAHTVIYRCMEYGKKNFPDYDFTTQYQRAREHIEDKYGENGYLKLWLDTGKNRDGLLELRRLLKNPAELEAICKQYY